MPQNLIQLFCVQHVLKDIFPNNPRQYFGIQTLIICMCACEDLYGKILKFGLNGRKCIRDNNFVSGSVTAMYGNKYAKWYNFLQTANGREKERFLLLQNIQLKLY